MIWNTLHFLAVSSSMFTNMADYEFHVGDFVSLGAANSKGNIIQITKPLVSNVNSVDVNRKHP